YEQATSLYLQAASIETAPRTRVTLVMDVAAILCFLFCVVFAFVPGFQRRIVSCRLLKGNEELQKLQKSDEPSSEPSSRDGNVKTEPSLEQQVGLTTRQGVVSNLEIAEAANNQAEPETPALGPQILEGELSDDESSRKSHEIWSGSFASVGEAMAAADEILAAQND
ncbi:MAG: hypothetical protein SGILL_004546, partial [Bacillariaceae sp.]